MVKSVQTSSQACLVYIYLVLNFGTKITYRSTQKPSDPIQKSNFRLGHAMFKESHILFPKPTSLLFVTKFFLYLEPTLCILKYAVVNGFHVCLFSKFVKKHVQTVKMCIRFFRG